MSKVQKIAFGKIINNKKSEQEEMNEWWWSVGKRCLLKEGDSTLFGILSDISLMERCLPAWPMGGADFKMSNFGRLSNVISIPFHAVSKFLSVDCLNLSVIIKVVINGDLQKWLIF